MRSSCDVGEEVVIGTKAHDSKGVPADSTALLVQTVGHQEGPAGAVGPERLLAVVAAVEHGGAPREEILVSCGKLGPWDVPSTLKLGTPIRMFDTKYASPLAVRSYDMAPAGQKFVMMKESHDMTATPASLVVVLDWLQELKARMAAGK